MLLQDLVFFTLAVYPELQFRSQTLPGTLRARRARETPVAGRGVRKRFFVMILFFWAVQRLAHPFWQCPKKLMRVRHQEKGVLAKEVSEESVVHVQETKKYQGCWTQQYIWHSERQAKRGVDLCRNPLLKIDCSPRGGTEDFRLQQRSKKRTQPPPKEDLLENFSGLKEKLSRPVGDTKTLQKPDPAQKSFLCGAHFFSKEKFCTGAGRCMLSFSQFNSCNGRVGVLGALSRAPALKTKNLSK